MSEIPESKNRTDDAKEEITKLKEDLRMCREIGVEMQRKVNRDLSAKYEALKKKLEIAAIRLKNIQHRADNFDSYITIENICIEALEEIEGEK